MPTLTRPPDAGMVTMPHHIVPPRDGDPVAVGVVAAPPEELLPSGGPDHHAATSRPAPAARPARRAPRTDAAFQRRVRGIHRQLLPIATRAALASSYGREAARRLDGPRPAATRRLVAVQVAYALRWLELADPTPTAPAVIERGARPEA